MRMIRSELLKIRTTNAWWWLGIGALAAIAVAFAFNAWYADLVLTGKAAEFTSPENLAVQQDVVYQATTIYTSGQYFGLMFVMLIGILMMTNEFFHQTATTTFLTTPRRTSVIFGKLATACLVGFGFWLITTVIDIAAGMVFFSVEGYGSQLDQWEVQRALLLNLLAYAAWTVLGVGIGTLITNQLAAVLIASVAYLIGTQVVGLAFYLLSELFDNPAIMEWQVILPSIASQVMISGADIPGLPSWWVGALVLFGYALITGVAGTLIVRRRDIA